MAINYINYNINLNFQNMKYKPGICENDSPKTETLNKTFCSLSLNKIRKNDSGSLSCSLKY